MNFVTGLSSFIFLIITGVLEFCKGSITRFSLDLKISKDISILSPDLLYPSPDSPVFDM